MTITIDETNVIQFLQNAVDTRGRDYIFPGNCVYQQNGKPHCVVGVLLDRVGLTGEQLIQLDNKPTDSSSIDEDSVLDILKSMNVEITPDAVRALAAAQISQDTGLSWGEALDAAIQALNKHEDHESAAFV